MWGAGGIFGPQAKVQNVTVLEERFKNVSVTSSKSRKFSTGIFQTFFKNVVKLYVFTNRYLLIVDSWGGQTNSTIYNKIFSDVENV